MGAVGSPFGFELVQDGPSRIDHVEVVRQARFFAYPIGVGLEAGLADEEGGVANAAQGGHAAVHPQEPAFPVLEIDEIGDVVRQDVERPQLPLEGAIAGLQLGHAPPQVLHGLVASVARLIRSFARHYLSSQALGCALA
jgi:hypothetical protein